MALAASSVTPTQITIVATILGMLSAYMIALGSVYAAIIVLFASQILDCADGDLARLTNRATRAGAYLDRVLDRFVDAALIIALTALNPVQFWLLGVLALTATFGVSISRVMAEAVGAGCKVGLASRDFRILLIITGLLLNQIYALLTALAILGFATTLHRMVHAMNQMRLSI